MTDELSIQAQQPQRTSATPYVLGGAALGAAGGYLGAKYTTSPKYASYEEIIKEAEDTFKKNVGEMTEDSSVIDKAIAARKAGVDAGANWDAELAKAKASKDAIKSEAEILKAVEEKFGTREKVVKEAMEKGKDDLKVALERKISNKKLAAWIAGGAVALAAIGYIFAPKNNQA